MIGRLRYRGEAGARGYRHGHRARELLGTLGRVALDVPRARIVDPEGNRFEFRSVLLPRYQHLVSRAAGTDRNRSSPAQCGSGCSSGALPDA